MSNRCPDLKMCLTNSTTRYELMSGEFEDWLVVKDSTADTIKAFVQGNCNVAASGIIGLSEKSIRKYYNGTYDIGNMSFSRESGALVTNEDDPVFSKLVDLVVNAILYADEKNITQADSLEMPQINLFHPSVNDTNMLRNIIGAVGKYQEIWDRHFGILNIARDARNELNRYPFGPMLITEQTWNKPPPPRWKYQ